MTSKVVSFFICAVMITTVLGEIPQIVGQSSSSKNEREFHTDLFPQDVGEPSSSMSEIENLADSPWPTIQQKLDHKGLKPYDTSANPGKLKRIFTTGDNIISSPAIGFDSTIYVGSQNRKLYAPGTPTKNQTPIAEAGPNQTINEGDTVQFNGSDSTGSKGHLVKDPNVVALWHINEGSDNVIYDETDNHHDGTINDATWITDGKFGSALSFDGVDDYVEIKPSDQIFGDNPDEWSYMVWFKTSNDVDELNIISDYNQDANESTSFGDRNVAINLFLEDNLLNTGIRCTIGIFGQGRGIGIGYNYANEIWYLAVVTVSKIDEVSILYLNGRRITSFDLTNFMPNGDYFDGEMLRIGARYVDELVTGHFQGSLDEVVLFDRALTAQEILDYYDSDEEYHIQDVTVTTDIISYEWDFDSNGIYDYKETPSNAPDGTFDGMTTHTYGDNGYYEVTLRIIDESNATDTDSCIITVNNVDPLILPISPFIIDEAIPITLNLTAVDDGSDDLTITLNWGYGIPEVSNTFYNDGTGPDPYPSPTGTHPFMASDMQSHTFGDNGLFNVTLTVTDDDGGSSVFIIRITVLNVNPTVTIETALMDVEIGLRIAGRKYNNVSLTLYEEGCQLGYVSIERLPGSPNVQMAWIPYILDMTKAYSATVTYEPEDPPNLGGNPVWIYVKFENGSIKKIHHTFNVQQSKKKNSEHWNHIEPWEVDLNAHLIGCPFEVTYYVTDPGSDDEILTFTYGSQNVTVTYINNPPNPDPFPSPEINPRDIMDTTTLIYEGSGSVVLQVEDDDGGLDSASIYIT
jgi:hypothetical protein